MPGEIAVDGAPERMRKRRVKSTMICDSANSHIRAGMISTVIKLIKHAAIEAPEEAHLNGLCCYQRLFSHE
jgi:hypothetical protein